MPYTDQFLGEIRMFGGPFAPEGWALCYGQIIPVQENPALYELLGNTYGGKAGESFALPSMYFRTPVHQGTGIGLTPRSLGERFGENSSYIFPSNLPSHTHSLLASSDVAVDRRPQSNAVATGSGTAADRNLARIYSTNEPTTEMDYSAIGNLLNSYSPGGSKRFTNVMPCQAINFIIALEGAIPPRKAS